MDASLNTRLPSVKDTLTLKTIVSAILLGAVVCLANMYFGLQAGMVNAMPMQSALLGFAFFRAVEPRLSKPLSPTETTLIEVIAGAIGLAPFTSGFTSFIPALEFLATKEENGPTRFSFSQLLLWSIATCGLGIVAGAPFRNLFILHERLRYPSATATGTLIGVLFKKEDIVSRARLSQTAQSPSEPWEAESDHEATAAGLEESQSPEVESEATNETSSDGQDLPLDDTDHVFMQNGNGPAITVLLYSLAGSAMFSLVSYFLPILRRVPIFGLTVAKGWLWAFDLSPAYVGYGIIIGPAINASILLGAIIGWGILSPVAKNKGWASGPVNDFDHGSRGWILWVGMGLILGDTLIGLGWITLKPLLPWSRRVIKAYLNRNERSSIDEHAEEVPLLPDSLIKSNLNDDDWPSKSVATNALVVWTGIGLSLLCLISLLVAFHEVVSAFASLATVVLIPFAGFISMRSLGETDNGASLAIGRLAQFMITLMVPNSSQKYTAANLLLGGAIESGASQAAQQMGGLRTAYMTKTAPRAVFYGQLIGSYIGALIATILYKIYTSVKKIPSEEFGVPDAHLYLVASRFIRRQGLPQGALNFALGAFFLGAAFSTLRILSSACWWRKYIPSGVAMAVGMYVVPAITLPRAIGGLLLVVGQTQFGVKNFTLICSATGLILGQGLFSLVGLLFDALHVSTVGPSH